MQSNVASKPAWAQSPQGLRAITFAERGTSVAFTTPFLIGARIRPAARGGTEMVVANASGGAGVYVMPWEGVRAMCAPTLHDRRLNIMLSEQQGIDPESMRRAAMDVAEEGLAGRPAAASVEAARAEALNQRLNLHFELLLDLIRTVEQRDRSWLPPDHGDRAALELRARKALAVLSPHIGRPAQDLFDTVEDIATTFRNVGGSAKPDDARLPRLVAEVRELPKRIGKWPHAIGKDGTPDTVLVQQAVGLTVGLATATLTAARTLLGDLPRLIRRWPTDKVEIKRLAERPEWVLDGWERICLLWQVADATFGRPLALRELMTLLPMMPMEANSWANVGGDASVEGLIRRRMAKQVDDWRAGITQPDLIARNERLRAMAPAGPA